jgi:hypothetical protein
VQRILALSLGAAALLALAACGGGGGNTASTSAGTTTVSSGAPTLGTLASDVVSAQKGKHSAHYAVDASFDIKTSGSSSVPGLSALAGKPITLKVSGDASSKAFTADGSVSLGGKSYSGKLLAGSGALYVNLLGSWYGSTKLGLDSLKRYGSSTSTTTTQQLDQIRKNAGEALKGTVADGPTLDGVSTWEFKGTLDANGLAKLSQDQTGKAMTAQQKQALQVIQDATSFTMDVGKDDSLLRRVSMKMDLPADKLQQLNQSGSSSSLNGVESVNLSFTLDLSKWGEPVTISPPSSFQPFSALLGGLFGSGGLSGLPGA